MSWDTAEQTLHEMMTDRGINQWEYLPSDCILLDGFLIYLCKSEKFNIESVKHLIFQLQQYKFKHGIAVYQNFITSSAKKAIDHLQDYDIELFQLKELQYNITKHRFYSPHSIISKESMLKELPSLQVSQLPIILRTDPVCRYFHFNRGDIIQIKRQNNTIAYRLVK